MDQVEEAKADAANKNKVIEKIIFTDDEWLELREAIYCAPHFKIRDKKFNKICGIPFEVEMWK